MTISTRVVATLAGALWMGCGRAHVNLGVYADVLELEVVDEQPWDQPPVPLEGVLVLADSAGGRIAATTDAEGRARIEGLDFRGDPPDVTFYEPDHVLETILDLGSEGPPPAPLRFAISPRENPGPATASVRGGIVRTEPGSVVDCMVTGGDWWFGDGTQDAYEIEYALDFPHERRIGCLEYREEGDGYALLSAFQERIGGPEVTVTFEPGPIHRFDVDIADHSTPGGAFSERFGPGGFVVDDDGSPSELLIGGVESVAQTKAGWVVHMAYVDTGAPAPTVFVDGGIPGGFAYWFVRRPVPPDGVDSVTVEMSDPPMPAPSDEVSLPGPPFDVVDPGFGDGLRVHLETPEAEILYWQLHVPPGHAVELPAPPPGLAFEDVVPDAIFMLTLATFDWECDLFLDYEGFVAGCPERGGVQSRDYVRRASEE